MVLGWILGFTHASHVLSVTGSSLQPLAQLGSCTEGNENGCEETSGDLPVLLVRSDGAWSGFGVGD